MNSTYMNSTHKNSYSLVIPAHDARGTLDRALGSVATQTRPFDEVIVVCDRCTDDTAAIARAWGATAILADQGHPGLARNIGIDAARGDYLLFLDADDYFIRDEALALIDARLLACGNPDVLHYACMWGPDVCSPVGWRAHSYGLVHTRAWSRAAIGSHRFADEAFAEDEAFCRRVFATGVSHEVLDVPLTQYVFPNEDSFTGRWLRGGHRPVITSA